MRITAELSLYPLRDEPIPVILEFIGSIDRDDRVEVVVNQMSTQLRGELDDVMRCVHGALRRSFDSGGAQVLVAKFLSSDLPIGSPPDLDEHR